jgi:hypothetical protein
LNWGGRTRPYAEWIETLFRELGTEALAHYPDGAMASVRKSARELGGDLIIIHGTWTGWKRRGHQAGPTFSATASTALL